MNFKLPKISLALRSKHFHILEQFLSATKDIHNFFFFSFSLHDNESEAIRRICGLLLVTELMCCCLSYALWKKEKHVKNLTRCFAYVLARNVCAAPRISEDELAL